MLTVKDGVLHVPVVGMNKFTAIEFVRAEPEAGNAQEAAADKQ